MTAIADEKYVRLTTFTKDGRPKHTPVWIAEVGDDTVGFTTGVNSWKVKRIRNTPRVELTPSSMRGAAVEGAATVTGTAAVTTGPDAIAATRAIKAKYGFQYTLTRMTDRVRSMIGKSDGDTCGVVITLD